MGAAAVRRRTEAEVRRRIESVDYCEDERTPGLLGSIAGATDWERREVKVATLGRTRDDILGTLWHELRHVTDASWDCGNRDVLGRGGER